MNRLDFDAPGPGDAYVLRIEDHVGRRLKVVTTHADVERFDGSAAKLLASEAEALVNLLDLADKEPQAHGVTKGAGKLTTDPKDPRLGRPSDKGDGQHDVYLVLGEDERKEGWVRPYRDAYVHVGSNGVRYDLFDLTPEQAARYADKDYVKFERYPLSEAPKTGKFWTQEALDEIGKGCGTLTRMGRALSETYARDPKFYGATYCAGCRIHRPLGEFVWDADGKVVGS